MLKKGDKIALVACSNAQSLKNKDKINSIVKYFNELDIEVVLGKYIFSDNFYAGSAKEKAEDLTKFYLDNDIKAIFDISGGDLANELLNYLNLENIKNNYKPFFGYSDLTTIINAFYTVTGKYQYLYQIRNILYDYKEIQKERINNSLLNNKEDLFDINYKFIKGSSMSGILVGGNIRCLLKLAGTEHMPDFKNKILFLESYSGDEPKIITFLSQLEQMRVFDKVSGILFGTFLELEQKKSNYIESIALKFFEDYQINIAVTKDVGHKTNSKAVIIGKLYNFNNK